MIVFVPGAPCLQGTDIDVGIDLASLFFQGSDFFLTVVPGVDDENAVVSDLLQDLLFPRVLMGESGKDGNRIVNGIRFRQGRRDDQQKEEDNSGDCQDPPVIISDEKHRCVKLLCGFPL